MLQLKDGAVHVIAVLGFHFIQPLIRVPVHGAELPHAKLPTIQPGTFLAVKDRATIRQLDSHSRQHPQG